MISIRTSCLMSILHSINWVYHKIFKVYPIIKHVFHLEGGVFKIFSAMTIFASWSSIHGIFLGWGVCGLINLQGNLAKYQLYTYKYIFFILKYIIFVHIYMCVYVCLYTHTEKLSTWISICRQIMIWCMCIQSLKHVCLFAIPWTVAHLAPLSMGLSRQEYCSG